MPMARRELWFRSFAFTVTVVAIGYALQISNGHLNGTALILLTFALAAASTGIAGPCFPTFERRGRKIVFSTAAAGLSFQLWSMFRTPPGIYLHLSDPELYSIYLGGVVLAAAVAALSIQHVRPQVWLPLLAAVHFVLGVWMIRMSPAPRIDVFYNQSAACSALLHGRNPYTITYHDIYASADGENSSQAEATKIFGYPPVSYLCAIPGYLAGDVRYSQLAAMSLAALVFGLARPSQLSALMAALFLFTPRTFFVLEQAWTEPFVLLFFAAVVFCKIRGYPKLLPLFLGLLISSKQHMFLTVPAIALIADGPYFRWKKYARLLGQSAVMAGTVTLPFFFWNPEASYHALSNFSTVGLRTDSLSYPAWLFLHGGPYLASAFDLIISLLVLAISLWLLSRSPSGFAASAGMTYFTLALFSIAAFCNYYYMIVGLMCTAVAVGDPGGLVAPRESTHRTRLPRSWGSPHLQQQVGLRTEIGACDRRSSTEPGSSERSGTETPD
jgi:hypothetical protein